MMFKQAMADLILAGKKTETRRLPSKSKRDYAVGSIQPIQTSYRKKAVGHIKIVGFYYQRLCGMADANVKAEGFDNWSEFFAYINKVNERHIDASEIVKVYVFELVKEDKT